MSTLKTGKLEELLGADAKSLLGHTCKTITKGQLNLPGADFVDRSFALSNRNPQVMRSIQALYGNGRLANSGYMSILPVDQGIEHSAGASFAPNPIYFDGDKIVELAIEGGCNAVASTYGVLGSVARKYAHKIPFIVKINHNELMTLPNRFDQVMFGTVESAWDMGAVAVGATIYFGSEESTRQITEVAEAFQYAHELGMATILWCYLRNPGFKKDGKDYHTAADLTAQANHLGVTIQADIIKQKLPESNGGYTAMGSGYGKTHKKVYSDLTTDHPDRPLPLPSGQLLHGPHRLDQQRRSQQRRQRYGRSRAHRSDQQARRWPRPHQWSQGLPASDEGRHPIAERHSGRVLG
jgi:class I fructose-bisphosphate aldolase